MVRYSTHRERHRDKWVGHECAIRWPTVGREPVPCRCPARIDWSLLSGYRFAMTLNFQPEQEARLRKAAGIQGRRVEDVVLEATLFMLQHDDAWHEASLSRSIAQADRGEFIEEDEMAARVARLIQR